MKKLLCLFSVTFTVAIAAFFTGCAAKVNKYTVSFNANGASGAIESVEVKEGDYTIPENGFTYDGKYFLGFRTGSDIYQTGDTYSLKADTTFTAVWGIKVTYTGLAASESNEAIVEMNTAYTPKTPAEIEHKTFTGWYTDSSLETAYSGSAGSTDFNLFPKYESYSNYQVYGLDNKLITSKKVEYGTKSTDIVDGITLDIPAGYSFDCWMTETNEMLFDGDGKCVGQVWDEVANRYVTGLVDYVSEYYNPATTIKIYPNVYDSRLAFVENYNETSVKPADGADLSDAELIVPAYYRGVKVTSTEKTSVSAFANTLIKSIEFPETFETVWGGSFENCSNLTTVKFNSSVAIGRAAFRGCTALSDFDVKLKIGSAYSGSREMAIGENAFSNAFADDAKIIIDLSDVVDENGKLLVLSSGEYTWNAVDNSAFRGSDSEAGIRGAELTLKGLKVLPSAPTANPANGFFAYSDIKKLKIEGVESYGDYCFAYTSLCLSDVTYVARKTTFGKYCFAYSQYGKDSATTDVVFEIRGLSEIPEGFIANSEYITQIPLDNVTTIGDFAFRDCINIDTVEISADCTYIADSAFTGCAKLLDKENSDFIIDPANEVYHVTDDYVKSRDNTQIIFDYNVNGAEEDDGNGGTILVKRLAGSLTSIAANAYTGATFNKVVIPASVTSIGANAFSGCTNLSEVVFLKRADGSCDLQTISAAAFKGCTSLVSITIPYRVETLEGASSTGVFNGCTNLETVTFEGSVEHPSCIKSLISSFSALTNLKSVTFSSDYYLGKQEIGENGLDLGATVFQGCTSLNIILPWYTKSITNTTFGRASTTTTKSINALAFADDIILKAIPDNALNGVAAIWAKDNDGNGIINDGVIETTSELVIPKSVTTIGGKILGGKTGGTKTALTKISFEEGSALKSVGASAFGYGFIGTANAYKTLDFSNCSQLETLGNYFAGGATATNGQYVNVILNGASVKSVGTGMIGGTNTNITLKVVGGISGYLAENFKKLCMATAGNGPKVITIEGITEIPANLFKNNTVVTQINLDDNTTSIGANAFEGCTALDYVITDKVIAIGAEAFKNVKSVDVSAIVAGLNDGTVAYEANSFSGTAVKGYTGVAVKDGVLTMYGEETAGQTTLDLSTYSFTKVGESVFKGNTSLTSVTLPTTATTIGANAFDGCSALQYINLDNVTTIDASAFNGCAQLGALAATDATKSINLSKAETIGASAFAGCTNLGALNLTAATSIGNSAFSKAGVMSLTLGENLTTIGEKAFENASDTARTNTFTTLNIPKSVTSIGVSAFIYSNITTLTFSDRANGDGTYATLTIGNTAFQYSKLGNGAADGYTLELPKGLTTIGTSAFANSSSVKTNNITEIIIPSSVTNIGGSAFLYMLSLKKVTFSERTENVTLGSKVFGNCTGLLATAESADNGVYVYGSGKIITTQTSYSNSPFNAVGSATSKINIYVVTANVDWYSGTENKAGLKPATNGPFLNYTALPETSQPETPEQTA